MISTEKQGQGKRTEQAHGRETALVAGLPEGCVATVAAWTYL
jgi:hypothetical protein